MTNSVNALPAGGGGDSRSTAWRVLWLDAGSAAVAVALDGVAGIDVLRAPLALFDEAIEIGGCDLVLLDAVGFDITAPLPTRIAALAHDMPLVAVVADGLARGPLPWVAVGVQDMLPLSAVDAATLQRSLHLSMARKRREHEARTEYSTDLATGLPNRQQLIEHMTHLIALREREPAPMALLVVRLEGLQTVASSHGADVAGVLRRKLAVRLRGALRASDVVASIAGDMYAVLLSTLEQPDDVDRVVAKLQASLLQPVAVAGQLLGIGAYIAKVMYPAQAGDAIGLLRSAIAEATGGAPQGREGFANFLETGGARAAANDAAS